MIDQSAPQEYLGIDRQRVKPNDYMERRRRYLVRWTSLKAERSRQWSVWQELAEYMMPERGRFNTSDHNKPKSTNKILNGSPTRMLRSLAAGLLSGHTSPARPWVNVTLDNPDLAEYAPVKQALYKLSRLILRVFEIANLYRALAMGIYPDLGLFGLGTMLAEESIDTVLRFVPLTMGTYGIAQNGDGVVDTLQYEEAWTVGELIKTFGWNKVSNSVRTAWNGGIYEQYVSVLRTIETNDEFIPGYAGRLGKPFGSAWMELGGLSGAGGALAEPSSDPAIGLLRDGGYEEFPVMCARWATTSRDVYPVGPGHDARPDVRQLMKLESRKLLGLDKGVNPAMLIPDAMRVSRLAGLPGDSIYVPTGVDDKVIRPAFVPQAEYVKMAREEIQTVLGRVGQHFFTELMLMFTDGDPSKGTQPISAQEVAAKQQEKMLMLGPVLENINDFLARLVERTIAVLGRRGMLPKFPREAKYARLKVQFISTLAQAQKLVGVQQKERLIQFVGQVSQLRPEARDLLNPDFLVRSYSDDLGNAPDVLETEEQVQAIRQERQRQAQIAQQAQALTTAAEAASKVGGVKMDEDNMVTRMIGPVAGTSAGGGL